MGSEGGLILVLGISTVWIVLIIIIAVLAGALVAITIYGRRLQAKQEKSQKDLEAAAQPVSFLVIDKKKMKLNESGLPQMVIDQTPKYMRGRKVPIVKAKVGPKIMTLMCDEKVYDVIPLRKSVKATVSGIYIMEVKGLRTTLETKKGKPTFRDRLRTRMDSMKKDIDAEQAIRDAKREHKKRQRKG